MSDISSTPQTAPVTTPVTVVVSRRVKPGCDIEFEAFLGGVIAACSQFPGYLGSNIFRPASADDPEYRVVFKFDSLSNLRQWEASKERQQWFTKATALTECPPQIQVLTGLETWFTLPGKAAIVPPPRYKMALITWLTVFPLITAISTVLHTQLALLPVVLRVMVVTAIAVPTMTYILMPQVTRLFAAWLYPKPVDEPNDQSQADSFTLAPSAYLSLDSQLDDQPMLLEPVLEPVLLEPELDAAQTALVLSTSSQQSSASL